MSSPRIAIITANFYQDISRDLEQAAEDVLSEHQCTIDKIVVPGCFEIPAALHIAIESGRFDGAITLGCVIRGETTHYDYVCQESARGINDLATRYKFPVGYGIITAENQEQANVRADKAQKNVGGRAASACMAMLHIKNELLT